MLSLRLPEYYSPVPSKASRSNGNGNGHCRIHSRAGMACRVCLVQGLQEFRFTNLRAGLRIAAERITALRADYAAKGGAEVKAALVAYELGTLLARLQAAEGRVEDLPVDAGVMISAMGKVNGRRVAGRAS